MSEQIDVSFEDVRAAEKNIRQYLKPTPLIFNPWLSEEFSANIYLKLETYQPIGSFKIRGALNKISTLSEAEKEKGLIAASAGNHSQGVAWSASKLGVKATIVMPEGAPLIKVQNTRSLGAEVVLHGRDYEDACDHALEIEKRTGKVFVHPYRDARVIAGQGTTGLEIVSELPEADFIVGAVGGGGLMAGLGAALSGKKKIKLVGVQSSGSPATIQSLVSGKLVTDGKTDTIADGTATRAAEQVMVDLLKKYLHHPVIADEEKVVASVLMLLEKAKLVVEGAGALPLAAMYSLKEEIKGKNVVLVISGGNIDVNLLARIIDSSMTRTGRRLRLSVMAFDQPGTLKKITDLVAQQGANILQVIHDRNKPSARFDQTEVQLTLETKGQTHSQKIVEAFRSNGLEAEVFH